MSFVGGARPLDPWRWLGVPLGWTLVWTLVLGMPVRIAGLPLPEPVIAMVPVFAWAVIRPSIIAPFAILLMGLFLDLFWGSPMGLWALSLLVSYGVVLSARSMLVGQSRAMMWAWFAGSTGVAMLAGFLFTMLDVETIPNLLGMAFQFLATIVLFPFAHRLIDRFEDADVRFR